MLKPLPPPKPPGPGQLLVRMLRAPLNPADRLAIAGSYAAPGGLPEVLGAEGLGTVEQIGESVSGFAAGDRVILLSRGNWASWRLVPAAEAMPVPHGLGDEQAAMLRINPATAWRLLDGLALSPGDWLAQNAARSSVARWVRLLARRRGLGVIDVVRAPAGGAEIEDGEELAERVAETADGAPVRGALDAVAGEATGRLASCLAAGGALTVYGHLSGRPCSIPSMLLTTRMLRVSGFSLRPAEQAERRDRRAAIYEELAALAVEAPEPVAATWGLSEIEQALAASQAPDRRGRILLALDR